MAEWKSIGPVSKDDNEQLWVQMSSYMDTINSATQAEFDKNKADPDADKRKFAEVEEYGTDIYGNRISTYSKGSMASVHKTYNKQDGYGKTTLHPDGSSHHHGTHAHVGGKGQGKKASSFTRDGKMTRK